MYYNYSASHHWRELYSVLQYETIDSTNLAAIRLARCGITQPCVITSSMQFHGRGTKGREWVSAPRNLNMSILLHFANASLEPKYGQIQFITSNAVYEAINKLYSSPLQEKISLKWPNDILINSRKVGGILLESISIDGNLYIVIGIGINIYEHPTIISDTMRSTSLVEEGLSYIESTTLRDHIMDAFYPTFYMWSPSTFSNIKDIWISRCSQVGDTINLKIYDKDVCGVFEGINEYGYALIRDKNGTLNIVYGY